MDKDKFFPYSWHIDDEEDQVTVIRIYGLDKNNKSVCVIVNNFQPHVYIELPSNYEWNEIRAKMLSNKLDRICGHDEDKACKNSCRCFKPLKKSLEMKSKLYYANVKKDSTNTYKTKLFPYLLLNFSTTDEIKKLYYRLKNPILVAGLGYVKLKVHESDANPILQFVCKKNIPTAGWIIFAGKKIEHKESFCEKEYIVKYENFVKAKDDDSVPKPLIMGFDIEVNSHNPNAMPKAINKNDKVFQISCILARHGEKEENFENYLLTLGEPDHKIVGEDVEIREFYSEDDLLVGFTKLIVEKNPQVIVGYNILGFDIPYMIQRSRDPCCCCYDFDKMGCRINHHAKERTIKWSSSAYKNQEFKFLDAEGRLFVDLLPLIKRDYKFDNYKLKTVSTFFLGETKDPLNPKGIFKCYRVGMKGGKRGAKALGVVGKYCVQDSVLVVKLFNTIQSWVGLCEMAKTCNVPIFYLYTQGQQIKVFSQVYKYCMYNNIVVEKDGYKAQENEQYTGAYVIEPIPGAYDRVVPFDFSSLYPTTIIAFNIDYSTLVTDEAIPDKDCNIFEWEDHVGCEHDTVKRKTKPKNIICAKHRYRFIKSPMGVMPSLLKFLLGARANTRKEIKEINKRINTEDLSDEEKISLKTKCVVLDKRQLAYKVSANSMYGAMGVKRGYLPFLPGAMCTTARGRQSIEKAGSIIQKKYKGQLIYGDTDSCYIYFSHVKTAEEIWDYCLEVENELYNMDIFPKPMKLAFEEVIYWRFFILTKKRYMYLQCGRDGIVSNKVGTKGVLLARRDNSLFIRKLYEEVVMKIFNKIDKEELLNLIIDRINELCASSYPQKDFIVTKSVGNTLDYKIRSLATDPKKRTKRLNDLQILEEWEKIPPRKCNQNVYKNKLEEIYALKSLPAQVQLAEKMRRRGLRVDPGTRLEYVITNIGNLKAKLADKIEDPQYQQENSDNIKIDYLYYLNLSSNPLDQALEVAYNIKNFVHEQYKLRVTKYKLLEEFKNLYKTTLIFN